MEKKSTTPIDSGGRETYFGTINLEQNFWKFFQNTSKSHTPRKWRKNEGDEKIGTMDIYQNLDSSG